MDRIPVRVRMRCACVNLRRLKPDLYTKIVLTVTALMLMVIAWTAEPKPPVCQRQTFS